MTLSPDSTLPSTDPVAVVDIPTVDAPTFAELNLPAALERAVADLGFTTPSAIQHQAIPALLAGRDITGVAQTGTGKTAAFGLPLLAAIDPALGRVQALVLTPTRELAMQVAEAIESFARHLGGVETIAVYGGSPFVPQQRALDRGAQVVVGTPGRVIDHIDRGTLKLDEVKFLVLDEADEMLRMGFAEDVEKIFGAAPKERQVALFSATMPPAIRRVANEHLSNPVEIATSRQSSTVTGVQQSYAVVPYRHKAGALARVLAVTEAEAAIVFVRTRGAAEEVGSALVERGISAAYISGDVAQGEREKIVERLRSGALDVLVATDVAARGLDVDRIGLVVNFDTPSEPETYVHRIGRTGRAGRTGEALTFVTPSEQHRLRQIERLTRTQLTELRIPSPVDVSAHRVQQLLGKVTERVVAGRLDLYREAVAVFGAQNPGTDIEDLVAALAALAVGDEGPEARPAHGDDMDDALGRARFGAERPDRGARTDNRSDPRGEHRNGPRGGAGVRRAEGGTRYRVAVGHTHGAQPGAIVGALTNEGGLTGKDLGKIDIFPSFSLVEIQGTITPEAFDRIARARVAGKPLRIRLDDGPAPRANHAGHGASRPAGSGPREHRAPSTDRKARHRPVAY
ncbi:DEAD/DEAH box helicase [Cellulomonas fimi]|uniref:RNA helicase n=1 Tax=Cellulomonas fimi TaxID=1708 RepID=A0A7Y0M177_CELFI|nr:DEAD/DEAH box helicase [Cellulomonas fimi]NMR21559.1 DEAD/DEAH box helicase [Cellulomonas fimi]